MIINTGDDIMFVRSLRSSDLEFTKLGYRYSLFGVFWLDVVRWGGEFVGYEGNEYRPLTADEVKALGGASVPFRYYLPPGLIAILGLIEAAIVLHRRRSLKVVIPIGLAMFGLAGLMFAAGFVWEFLIPIVLGLVHILGGWTMVRLANERQPDAAG